MSSVHRTTRQLRLFAVCLAAALTAIIIVERAPATTAAATTDTPDCVLEMAGSKATMSWSDNGGVHVIRRNDRWIAAQRVFLL